MLLQVCHARAYRLLPSADNLRILTPVDTQGIDQRRRKFVKLSFIDSEQSMTLEDGLQYRRLAHLLEIQ